MSPGERVADQVSGIVLPPTLATAMFWEGVGDRRVGVPARLPVGDDVTAIVEWPSRWPHLRGRHVVKVQAAVAGHQRSFGVERVLLTNVRPGIKS